MPSSIGNLIGNTVLIKAKDIFGSSLNIFEKPLNATVKIPKSLISNEKLQGFKIYTWDHTKNSWGAIPAVIDTSQKTVSFKIEKSQEFGVFAFDEKQPAKILTFIPAKPIPRTFERNLGIGTKGEDVKALQKYLKEEGVYRSDITGYFGPITQSAVKKYQKKNGIKPQSGFVGPITLQVLNIKILVKK